MISQRKTLMWKELQSSIELEKKLQENGIELNHNILPPPIVVIPKEELYQNVNFNEKKLKDNFSNLGLSYNVKCNVIWYH